MRQASGPADPEHPVSRAPSVAANAPLPGIDEVDERLPEITEDSRITLHPLRSRREGTEWIVGRMDTGDFVALPETGFAAITLLRQNLRIRRVCRHLTETTGQDPDLIAFVRDLAGLGFVARVDGTEVRTALPPRPTWPRLRAAHVRWLLHPATPVFPAALILAAVVAVVRTPALLPTYHDLLFSPHGSVVLAVEFVGGWTLVFLHEVCHLLTARAAGVPGRIRLGTRLQFLVAHTDVSGIVTAPRRHRLTVYLAGMVFNVGTCAACVLLLVVLPDRAGAPQRLAAALAMVSLLSLPFEFMVFMRTDVYFVLEDLFGAKDLYGDGTSYARHLARRAADALRGLPPPVDPSAGLGARERRAVRAFSLVLVVGTVACLAVLARVTAPVDVHLLIGAVRRLLDRPRGWGALDAVAVLLVLGGGQAAWAVLWWRRHHARLLRPVVRVLRARGVRLPS